MFKLRLRRETYTNGLAVAALRSGSLRAVLLDELRTQQESGEPFGEEHRRALDTNVVNRASRASALMAAYYLSLSVVIEGWKSKNQPPPTLSDPTIDPLLASRFPDALHKYRNTLAHPSFLDDERATQFAAVHSELAQWAANLTDEFNRYFGEWRAAWKERAPNSESTKSAI